MNTNSASLISAWDALQGEPAVAHDGELVVHRGTKVLMSEYQAFTEDEKLETLNNLIGSKHCLVIAPSTCNTYVPISQMETDQLILSAKTKARNEVSAIIDEEIMPVFDEMVTLLNDPDPATAAQALEDVQDMIFDQTLRKLSKNHLKFFYFYLDDLMECLIMVLGNRKVISFDTKKIKAISHKNQAARAKQADSAQAATSKKPTKPRPPTSSSESSSESDSDSSSSSSSSSSEDGLIPEGKLTPVLSAKPVAPAAPVVQPVVQTPAQTHASDYFAAKKALLEAQQRVAALAAIGLSLQTQPAAQVSGAAFKAPSVPDVVLPPPVDSMEKSYQIPKKSAHLKKSGKRSSKHSKKSKSSRKHAKKSKKHRSHSKKPKHAKKEREQSCSESSSPIIESSSDSESPPLKKKLKPSRYYAVFVVKILPTLFCARVGSLVAQVEGPLATHYIMAGISKLGSWLGYKLSRIVLFVTPLLAAMPL